MTGMKIPQVSIFFVYKNNNRDPQEVSDSFDINNDRRKNDTISNGNV